MIKKSVIIVGKDKRQTEISRILASKGILTENYSENTDIKEKTVIFPTLFTKDGVHITGCDFLIDNFSDCYMKITGNCGSYYKKSNENIFEYAKCDSYKTLNAVPTVEGTLSEIITKRNETIFDSKILIIGYGAIGKRLADVLTALGSKITVSARKSTDFALLKSKSIDCINTSMINKTLSNFDVIVNTVPARIIESDTLYSLSEKVLIIDLASYPFGFDYEKIGSAHPKIELCSGLPGKYAYITAAKTAAEIIYDKIIEE